MLDIYRAIALGTAEFETEDALEIIFVSPLSKGPINQRRAKHLNQIHTTACPLVHWC